MASPIKQAATEVIEVVLKTLNGEDIIVAVDMPVGATREEAVAAVRQHAPRVAEFFSGAVSPEGHAQLTHWAQKPLDVIDPQKQLTGLSRRSPEANRLQGPDAAPPRSYYGVESSTNPYKREQGLGSVKHTATLDANKLYDAQANTKGLWGGGATPSEKAVKAAGYSGYYMDHPKLGKVAVVFEPLTARQLKEGGFANPTALAGTAGAILLGSALLAPQEAEAAWQDPALAALRKLYQAQVRTHAGERAVVRGTREMAKRPRLTTSERHAIEQELTRANAALEPEQQPGQLQDALQAALDYKARHPTSGVKNPWAKFELNAVDVSRNKKGEVTGYSAVPKAQAYKFNIDPRTGKAIPKGSPRYNRIVRNLTNEIVDIQRRAEAGDLDAIKIMGEAGWYQNVEKRLGKEYGSFKDMVGDLLGATSPNTPVETNFNFTRDILQRFSRGQFDDIVTQYASRMNEVDAIEATIAAQEAAVRAVKSPTLADLRKTPTYRELAARQRAAQRAGDTVEEDMVTRNMKDLEADVRARKAPTLGDYKRTEEYQRMTAEASRLREQAKADVIRQTSIHPDTGELKRYGINSENATLALAERWRYIKKGSAPKAKNFSGNLVGFSKEATIDVWAARNLRKHAGLPQIPSAGETGVTGEVTKVTDDAFESSGEFGFGQDVLRDATTQINKALGLDMDPRDVQALQWFAEKDQWSKNAWTSAKGEGGSFETMMDQSPTESLFMGTSRAQNMATQGRDFVPTGADQRAMADDVLSAFNADPDTIAAKAQTTHGYYKGQPETSFDIDVVSKLNEMNTEGMDAVAKWAVGDDQQSFFAARRIEDSLGNARPQDFQVGTEAYFRTPVAPDSDEIKKVIDVMDQNEIDGFTLITDPRGGTGDMPGKVIGFRFLDIPQYSDDPVKYANMSAADYGSHVNEKRQQFQNIGTQLADELPGLRSIEPGFFDVNVKSKEQAAEYLAQRARPGADPEKLNADFWGWKPATTRFKEAVGDVPARDPAPGDLPATPGADARPGAAPAVAAATGLAGLAAGAVQAAPQATPPPPPQQAQASAPAPLQGVQFNPADYLGQQIPTTTPPAVPDPTVSAPWQNFQPPEPGTGAYDPQGDPLLQAMGSDTVTPPSFPELVTDMFTGHLRETRATRELPEARNSGLLAGQDTARLAALSPALLTTTDPAEVAQILSQNFPDIGIQQDEKGNILAANNRTGVRAVLNKPGWTIMDTMQVLGLGAAYTPASRTLQGLPLLMKMGQMGGQAAATGAALEGVQAASGGEFDKTTPAWDFGLGAAAALPIVAPLRGLYQKIKNYGSSMP